MSKTKEDFFVPENLTGEPRVELSPSEKYLLVIMKYETKAGCWRYSRGLVQENTEEGKVIADVKRNYSSFPFGWIEDHPNGNDYLFCGEDYQGQTIIELNTGERIDFLPDRAQLGAGFCMVDYHPNPSKTILAVEGCYWACPYEVKFFDFTDPMSWNLEPKYKQPGSNNGDRFFGWISEDIAHIGDELELFQLPDNITAEDIEKIPNKEYPVKVHKINNKLYIDIDDSYMLSDLKDNTITEEMCDDDSRVVEIPKKVLWNVKKGELILDD